MSTIRLQCNNSSHFTPISNDFIDNHMAIANGDFVKVYLYIVRLLSSCEKEFSVTNLADLFNLTEKDVLRAIKYWAKEKLLFTTEEKNKIVSISLSNEDLNTENDLIHNHNEEKTEEIVSFDVIDQNLKDIITTFEQCRGKLFSANDYTIISKLFYEDKFSIELIEFAFDYALEIQKQKSLKNDDKKISVNIKMTYIQEILLSWRNLDIENVQEAKEYVDSIYCTIKKAFGIYDRELVNVEKDYIVRWQKMNFSKEILIEACNRTIIQLGKVNFNYANSILLQWQKNNITSLSDIEKLDNDHKSIQEKEYKNKPKNNKKLDFNNNFTPQKMTDIDFINLERAVL